MWEDIGVHAQYPMQVQLQRLILGGRGIDLMDEKHDIEI
jgi:hypothetical protein